MIPKNNILIVDDVKTNLILLDKILSDEGYNVISVSNGEDAIIYANENEVDLILLDIMMPRKDGFAVFEELKSKEKTANIPVIFITVINSDADTLKAFEMGAADYINKPFTPTELRIRIRTQIALVNARKYGSEGLYFTKNLNPEFENNPLLNLLNKLNFVKIQILDLQNAKFNNDEKENLKSLNKAAAEILRLLQNIIK